jgi:glucose-1-phosphate cytidylyltransferase
MKAVILAGGLGTRISEETVSIPKPLIEIGGKPILWHIMKSYSHHGVNEFIILCGYKGYAIKNYFMNYYIHQSDITIDITNNQTHLHKQNSEPWKVTLVDTGEDSMTGGRLKRVTEYLKDEECFCFTYGDGVSDVNITELIKQHKSHGKLATVTAVQPPGRYGALNLDKSSVTGFSEKPKGDGGWINGGYFVLSPKVIELIEGDATTWETEPMERLADNGELQAHFHKGFWQPMDTLRDKVQIDALWESGKAPWKVWD